MEVHRQFICAKHFMESLFLYSVSLSHVAVMLPLIPFHSFFCGSFSWRSFFPCRRDGVTVCRPKLQLSRWPAKAGGVVSLREFVMAAWLITSKRHASGMTRDYYSLKTQQKSMECTGQLTNVWIFFFLLVRQVLNYWIAYFWGHMFFSHRDMSLTKAKSSSPNPVIKEALLEQKGLLQKSLYSPICSAAVPDL